MMRLHKVCVCVHVLIISVTITSQVKWLGVLFNRILKNFQLNFSSLFPWSTRWIYSQENHFVILYVLFLSFSLFFFCYLILFIHSCTKCFISKCLNWEAGFAFLCGGCGDGGGGGKIIALTRADLSQMKCSSNWFII